MMPETIPSRLKLMRAHLKITQAEAAMRLGTGLRTYQDWESGRHAPATYQIINMACEALERKAK
jgi:DNA-binding transcriptional regulator YiaG